MPVRFGPFELDVRAVRLTRDGVPVAIQPKAFDLLARVVRERGGLVPNDVLRRDLWPDVVVTDQSLRQLLLKTREALGDHAHWLDTVPRRGLRFVGPLEPEPTRSEASVGGRFPAERDGFVGRQADLARVQDALDQGARLVTIVGPGGVGKTRLALQHLRSQPTGWFCDLAEARTVHGIAGAIGTTLDLSLDLADPVVQLGHALAARAPLLVLDNFEQIARHAEATVGRWLDRAGRARFVVTSRQRLGLPGEVVIALDPLPPADARELFVRRASAVNAGFPADDAAIPALVAALDGLPLAIELAAARVRILGPAEILERLRDRFGLLVASTGRIPRQAALRATLDWSWDLLDPLEQAALVQLSAFQGGIPLRAAEAVIEPAERALDLVQALVDQSWALAPVGGRLHQLIAVQEYAAERLPEVRAAAEVRHGAWFSSPGDGADLDNQITAVHRAIARGDGPVAGGAALAAWATLEVRGPIGLGADLLEAALAVPGSPAAALEAAACRACATAGRVDAAQEHGGRALALAEDPHQRAIVAYELAEIDRRLGRVDRARAGLDDASAAFAAAGDRVRVGWAHLRLGQLDHEQGLGPTARDRYRSALEIGRTTGDARLEGSALGQLGSLDLTEGRLDDADPHCVEALEAHRRGGHRLEEATALGRLGILRSMQGRTDEGAELFQAEFAAHRDLGHRSGEAVALGRLGTASAYVGRVQEALEHFQAAVERFREVGEPGGEALVLGNIGTLLVFQGWVERARIALAAALELHERLGQTGSAGFVRSQLGDCHALVGEVDAARASYDAALAIQRSPAHRAVTLARAARSDAGAGRSGWEADLDEALTLAEPFPEAAAAVLAERALLRARAGRHAEAAHDAGVARALDRRGITGALVAVASALVGSLAGEPDPAAIAVAEDRLAAMGVQPSAAAARDLAEARGSEGPRVGRDQGEGAG